MNATKKNTLELYEVARHIYIFMCDVINFSFKIKVLQRKRFISKNRFFQTV